MQLQQLFSTIDDLYPEMVRIRRYLHQYPELSFEETETATYIASFYDELAIPYETGVGGNGVVAMLKGAKPGRTVALRADFDALPIQEENDIPYKSKHDGVMHACGHDGHTATMLTIARVLKNYQEQLPGTVVFLHQHAEEFAPGGAKPMIEAGCLEGVEAVFGTHLWATTPFGVLQTSTEAFMAGTDRFEITIHGKGGHGGYPHETKDAIAIGAELVTQLQQIVSRRLDPSDTAVVTTGVFQAGNAFNVIPDQATLKGTVRYLNTAVQEQVIAEMENMTEGICRSFGVSNTFNYVKGYPPLVNHKQEAQRILDTCTEIEAITTAENVSPVMGGEDFSYYMLEKPGAYFFTGAEKEGYPHHHPKFNIDERALPVAAKTLIQAFATYQSDHPVD